MSTTPHLASREAFEAHNAELDRTQGTYAFVTGYGTLRMPRCEQPDAPAADLRGIRVAQGAARPGDTVIMVLSGRRSTDIQAAVRFYREFPENRRLFDSLMILLFELEGTQHPDVPDYLAYLYERAETELKLQNGAK